MAGIPVKLTFDPRYPDHVQALEILRAQKHTTQFVVNVILGAATPSELSPRQPVQPSNRKDTQVTERLPISNQRATQVTETDRTSLEDIPPELLGFVGEE